MTTSKRSPGIMANFIRYFVAKRKELNLTLTDVGERMKIVPSAIHKYENGKIGSLNDAVLAKTAKAFNVEIEEVHYALLGLEDLWRLRDKDILPFMRVDLPPLRDDVSLSTFLGLVLKCQKLETQGLQITPVVIKEVLSQQARK